MNTVENILNEMAAVIEHDGAIISSYKDDFYNFDTKFLKRYWHQEYKYLWIVRENGTHLALIGEAASLNEDIEFLIGHHKKANYYEVSKHGVKQISESQAHKLCNKTKYTVADSCIYNGKRVVVGFNTERFWNNEAGSVCSFLARSEKALTLPELILLELLSRKIMARAVNSLFFSTDKVMLNDESLSSILEQQQAA